jgi:hypothetical protein
MAGIFITYRRDDAFGVAGRLSDRLTQSFPRREIFMDVDAMKPGLDFAKQLDEQVAKCDVVLAVIGPGWLNATDDKGRRRIDLPRDYVRIELASALKREIPVIPLLVNGTALPSEEDLPDELKSLSHRHALELRHSRFSADSETLVTALSEILPGRTRWKPLPGAAVLLLLLVALTVAGLLFLRQTGSPLQNTAVLPPATAPIKKAPPDDKPVQTAALAPAQKAEPVLPPAAGATAAPANVTTVVPNLPSVVLASPAPATPPAFAGDKIALVIGNSKYAGMSPAPTVSVNDARRFADGLKRANFDVVTGENLSGPAMGQMLERFYGRIRPGSVVIFFFSGVGIQSNNQTYLIPIDPPIWSEADTRSNGFDLETILKTIDSRGATIKVALLDASRRNPFERRFRTYYAGLASVNAPIGTLVMYSTALGSVQNEGNNSSEGSVFVAELLKNVGVPNLTAEEALNKTRVGIISASRHEQVPYVSSSLAESFAFTRSLGAR